MNYNVFILFLIQICISRCDDKDSLSLSDNDIFLTNDETSTEEYDYPSEESGDTKAIENSTVPSRKNFTGTNSSIPFTSTTMLTTTEFIPTKATTTTVSTSTPADAIKIDTTSKKLTPPGIFLPDYVLYILVTVLLIMFLITSLLIFLLCKRNNKEYILYPGPNPSTIIQTGRDDLNTQEFNNVAPRQTIPNNDGRNVIGTNEIMYFRPEKQTVEMGPKKSLSSNDGEIKHNRITRRTASKTNVIPREKITQICRDALSKQRHLNSKSSKDFNKMFQELSTYVKNSSHVENMKEKSASTSMLEFYDTPQNVKTARTLGDDSSECEEISSIYQSPPATSASNVILDNDTQYLLPLAGNSTLEPTYINANRNY